MSISSSNNDGLEMIHYQFQVAIIEKQVSILVIAFGSSFEISIQ